MLELLLLGTWLLALRLAVAHREAVAVACGVAVGYLLLADTAAALATDRGDRNVFAFFNLALLGPGAGILRAPGLLPLPRWLLDYPLATRGLRCLLCAAVAARYLRQSAALHPLLARTAALESIAMAFVAVSTLEALEGIVLAMGWALTKSGGYAP